MTFHVQTCVGNGVLARYGDSLVLAPADSPVLDALLDLARETQRDHGDEPGRFLPRKVAGLVAASDQPPTLAVVSALSDGLALLLVGDVSVTLDDGTVLSGRDATTWVDRIVRDPWSSVQLQLTGAGEPDARSDLQGGVVTAGGAHLSSAPVSAAPAASGFPEAPLATSTSPSAVAAEPEPVVEPAPEPTPPPAPFESFSLTQQEPFAPLPVAGGDATMAMDLSAVDREDTTESGTRVQGIECSRQHFNDPAAVYCAICGISMVHQTHNLVSGIRPPLGVLVLDDGSVHTVDRDYVLGREPHGAPEIARGASGLTLDDPDVTMSRVHAHLKLVDWEARLVDAGSANGTYTAKAGEKDWTRLTPGEPAVLTPGTRIALGSRTMVFDSHHKL